MHNKLTLLIL